MAAPKQPAKAAPRKTTAPSPAPARARKATGAKGRRGTTVKTPATLKLVEGRGNGRDSGGRPIKATPVFKRLPPDMPGILWGDAKDEWERVVPELARLELVKPNDAAALAAYCLAWQRMCQAQRQIDEKGLTQETSQGVGVSPWVRVVEAASKELRAWAHEFGFTPAAESALGAGEKADGDDSNPFAG
jgi:P27 family predicted phage terminase small subunit